MHPMRAAARLIPILLFVDISQAAPILLENDRWQVRLEPETFAIAARPAEGKEVKVSSGTEPHAVRALKAERQSAQWEWQEGKFRISASLKGDDLALSIAAAQPATLKVMDHPPESWSKGLAFPLAEGSMIPKDSKVWHDFLLEELSAFNTTQDISLPLWTLDQGDHSFSLILTNPFNNRGEFADHGDGLTLSLTHEFTSLDPTAPMTMLLHFGSKDPLAGAKRYRQWLEEQGKYQSLASKIQADPESAKLIGAPQTYLWGGGLLSAGDVSDWKALIARLKAGKGLAGALLDAMDKDTLAELQTVKGKPQLYQQKMLIRALNEAIDNLARKKWQTARPDLKRLPVIYADIRGQVATTFSGALGKDPARWGSGLSLKTVEKLRSSGISGLWIGLGEGWEPGLWHPEAVRAAVDAGFLIAPYDSYQTAIQEQDDPSWASAHLGEAAYRDCAIGRKDGSFKAGFQQTGHYTNPDCIRPVMQARMSAILSAAPFNSWFLDAYASGMVFDSYPPAQTITESQYAQGNEKSMRWVSEDLKLPLGSEDGKATTTRGLLFAQGMQTPVLGWGDKDMQKDKASPYFVGAWYPTEAPEKFFRTVPLKSLYRDIYFAPESRLPLYQAVFHGSVITTHHWLFDNLKFTNVRQENELAQLLYNVPPLYHLSADQLKARLPLITKQDAFFRPLHQRLATQKLTAFEWLTPDRLVQQTTFEDGTRLIANFSDESRNIGDFGLKAGMIAAVLPAEQEPVFYQASDGR